jgi:hypothetical protein
VSRAITVPTRSARTPLAVDNWPPVASPTTGDEQRRPQTEATDAEIHALVYELYGLTEEEIATVEGRD